MFVVLLYLIVIGHFPLSSLVGFLHISSKNISPASSNSRSCTFIALSVPLFKLLLILGTTITKSNPISAKTTSISVKVKPFFFISPSPL